MGESGPTEEYPHPKPAEKKRKVQSDQPKKTLEKNAISFFICRKCGLDKTDVAVTSFGGNFITAHLKLVRPLPHLVPRRIIYSRKQTWCWQTEVLR